MLLRQNPGHFSLICIVVHQVLAFDTGRVKSHCLMLSLNHCSPVLSCFIFSFTLFHSDTYLITSQAVPLPIILKKYVPAFRFHTGSQVVSHKHRVFDGTHWQASPKGKDDQSGWIHSLNLCRDLYSLVM